MIDTDTTFENYQRLVAEHKKVYNKKKHGKETYENHYWVDTKSSWSHLEKYRKELIILALEEAIVEGKI